LENCLEQAPSLRCTNYNNWLSHVFCKAAQIHNVLLWVMAHGRWAAVFRRNLPASIIRVGVIQ